MSLPQIAPAHELTVSDLEFLEARLYEHNASASGHDDGQGLGFVVRGADGRMIGAVAGYSWGGVAEIQRLWVEPPARGQGLGLALLDAALGEAERRGCVSVFVMTYDFQAPGLYARRGFRTEADIDGWPLSRRHLVLRKTLRA